MLCDWRDSMSYIFFIIKIMEHHLKNVFSLWLANFRISAWTSFRSSGKLRTLLTVFLIKDCYINWNWLEWNFQGKDETRRWKKRCRLFLCHSILEVTWDYLKPTYLIRHPLAWSAKQKIFWNFKMLFKTICSYIQNKLLSRYRYPRWNPPSGPL